MPQTDIIGHTVTVSYDERPDDHLDLAAKIIYRSDSGYILGNTPLPPGVHELLLHLTSEYAHVLTNNTTKEFLTRLPSWFPDEEPHEWRSIHDCYDYFKNDTSHEEDNELLELLAADPNLCVLPVYAYIHSGIALSLGPFSCPWDSGQSGWIVCSRPDADKWRGAPLSGSLEDFTKQQFESFRCWLCDPCYHVSIEDADGDNVDSCGGFQGKSWEDQFIADVCEHFPEEYDPHIKAAFDQIETPLTIDPEPS